jgi:glucosamine--fructose-6-phosphate aminotransferase (isomerizing)
MDYYQLDQNLYLSDVLDQPEALRSSIQSLELQSMLPLAQAVQRGDYDRIVLTGMGASLYSAYPAWLILAASGLPAVWVESAELLHYTPGLIGRRTLLWIVSQSGRSAEALALLERAHQSPPAALLLTVNDMESPLVKNLPEKGGFGPQTTLLPLNVEPEQAPSTRTYLVSLALNQLVALLLSRQPLESHLHHLEQTIDGISEYLVDWKVRLADIGKILGDVSHLVLLGRGASLASAHVGALMLQEVGKFPASSMSVASFRHGPLECISKNLTVLLFAGADCTYPLNLRMYDKMNNLGARVFWLQSPSFTGGQMQPGIPPSTVREAGMKASIGLPRSAGIGLPLAEIVTIQLLGAHLAIRSGLTPGEFLHSGKITFEE